MVIATSVAAPVAAAISATTSRIICRGTGLIAASPGGICRPGRVTVPTPSPAWKVTPAPGAFHAHRGAHQAAMRHVGVVAGVLDDRRPWPHRRPSSPLGQREAGRAAARQADGHRVGEAQPGQRAEGGLDRRRGAGTRGPAAPQPRGGASAVIRRLPAAGPGA